MQFNQKRKALTAAQRAEIDKANAEAIELANAAGAAQNADTDAAPMGNEDEDNPDLTGGDDELGDFSFETKSLTIEEQYKEYNNTVKGMLDYLKLQGMFEIKDG
jgi:hypothetical protein